MTADAEEKPAAGVVRTKRRVISDSESSEDAEIGAESNPVAKSPPQSPAAVKEDSDAEQKSLSPPPASKPSNAESSPASTENRTTDVESEEPVSEKENESDKGSESGREKEKESDAEVEKGHEEVNAETGEVCCKEPINKGK